jgi:hypothetical protein
MTAKLHSEIGLFHMWTHVSLFILHMKQPMYAADMNAALSLRLLYTAVNMSLNLLRSGYQQQLSFHEILAFLP